MHLVLDHASDSEDSALFNDEPKHHRYGFILCLILHGIHFWVEHALIDNLVPHALFRKAAEFGPQLETSEIPETASLVSPATPGTPGTPGRIPDAAQLEKIHAGHGERQGTLILLELKKEVL